jgi:hypothetical protein
MTAQRIHNGKGWKVQYRQRIAYGVTLAAAIRAALGL